MTRTMLIVVCGAMVCVFAVGCADDKQPNVVTTPITSAPITEEPKWVTSPMQAFPERAKTTFFGVGIAERRYHPGKNMRRRSATEAARLEVQSQLEIFIASVFKDYQEDVLTPNMDMAETQALTTAVTKSVVAGTLVGAQSEEIWGDSSTGDYYALVSLSMDSVAKQLKDKIAEVEKGKLRVAAEEAHQDLDRIIEAKQQEFLGQ